jgi:hypothetical protein
VRDKEDNDDQTEKDEQGVQEPPEQVASDGNVLLSRFSLTSVTPQ